MGLDAVEIVMEIEDHFNVELPDFELHQLRTVADLAALVTRRVPGSEEASSAVAPIEMSQGTTGGPVVSENWVLEEVRKLIGRNLCLPLEQVQPTSELVKDLGMD